ncbi:unnamed protein product [Brassica rapa]|uniref:Uncharacterized protein n=1 Tax=Brassica campestris TaxID=3711 RepID=A0A8D9I1J4_BRACM|nr:unnamed protein product [Brassica rapa]
MQTSVEEDMRLMRCVVSGLADRSTLIAVTELLFDGRSRILSGPKLTFIAKGQCCDMEPAIVEIYKNIGEKYSRLRYLEDAKEDNKTKWWI